MELILLSNCQCGLRGSGVSALWNAEQLQVLDGGEFSQTRYQIYLKVVVEYIPIGDGYGRYLNINKYGK